MSISSSISESSARDYCYCEYEMVVPETLDPLSESPSVVPENPNLSIDVLNDLSKKRRRNENEKRFVQELLAIWCPLALKLPTTEAPDLSLETMVPETPDLYLETMVPETLDLSLEMMVPETLDPLLEMMEILDPSIETMMPETAEGSKKRKRVEEKDDFFLKLLGDWVPSVLKLL